MIFNKFNNVNNKQINKYNIKDKINIFDFVRSYKIGKIPIIDFLITYILLYMLNKMYYHFNAKTIIVSTLVITIIINILLYNNIKFNSGIILIMLISIFYLIYLYYNNNL